MGGSTWICCDSTSRSSCHRHSRQNRCTCACDLPLDTRANRFCRQQMLPADSRRNYCRKFRGQRIQLSHCAIECDGFLISSPQKRIADRRSVGGCAECCKAIEQKSHNESGSSDGLASGEGAHVTGIADSVAGRSVAQRPNGICPREISIAHTSWQRRYGACLQSAR